MGWRRYIVREKYSPKVLLFAFAISILLVFVFPPQQSFAGEITYTVPAGITTLTFRDISSTIDTPNATASLNKSNYAIGETATITVSDFNANLNMSGIDFASAEVVMSSITSTVSLTETGLNTGIFTGTFTVTDNPSISYDQGPPDSPRMSVTFDMSSGGDITFSDVTFTPDECFGASGYRPVTHGVKIEYSNGAVQTAATDLDVTMSYANGAFHPLGFDIQTQTDMFYDSTGTPSTASLIRQGTVNTGGSSNNVLKRIFDDPGNAGFGGTITEGVFYLGYDAIGCGGGGGGGFVRAGLVVNALAGISSLTGGGGGTPGPTIYLGTVAKYDSASETISMPQEIRDLVNNHDPYTPLEPIDDIYEDFDLPLSINGIGFALGGYENTIQTQTIELGVPTEFNIVFYTNSDIAHTSLYFNLGPTKTIGGSDTQVLLYKDKPIQIIDPNGNIVSATGSINNEGDLKRVVTFSITFSEDIQWSNSDLIIRAWNDNLNSGDTIVYDAIQIAPSEEQTAFEQSIPEPEVEHLQSQHVPIWIKNNAAWWSQELIDDSDFVAGIEYLIQNRIITITDDQVIASSYSANQIPEWIKNNAGWWSENLISEKEFIDGLQWLISNGIIQVTET